MAVSVFLLSTLLAITLGALVPGIKVSRQAEESIAAQRDVVHAFDRLMSELALMDRTSLTTADGCISYLSHKPFRGTNPLLNVDKQEIFGFASLNSTWRKYVILRLRGTRLLVREHPYDLGSVLARIRPDELIAVADEPGLQEKNFARDIEEFSAVPVGTSRVQFRVRSVYRTAKKPESCDVTFQVVMRGSN